MKKSASVPLVNEIAASFINCYPENDIAHFLKSPEQFFLSNCKEEHKDGVLKFDYYPVMNTEKLVHLVLPYYSSLNSVKADSVSDGAMRVSGGGGGRSKSARENQSLVRLFSRYY